MRPNSSTSMSTKPAKMKVAVWKKILLVLGVILCAIVVFVASFIGAWALIGSQDFSSETAELKDTIDTLETENKTLKDRVKDLEGGSSSGKNSSKATSAPTATSTAKPTSSSTAKPTATPTAKPASTSTAKPTATPTAKPAETPKSSSSPSGSGNSGSDIPTINID